MLRACGNSSCEASGEGVSWAAGEFPWLLCLTAPSPASLPSFISSRELVTIQHTLDLYFALSLWLIVCFPDFSVARTQKKAWEVLMLSTFLVG